MNEFGSFGHICNFGPNTHFGHDELGNTVNVGYMDVFKQLDFVV